MNLASISYYYNSKTEVAGRAKTDTELCDRIERIQGEFPGYGYRRLGKQLRREGVGVNDKRIRAVCSANTSFTQYAGTVLRSLRPIPSMGTRFIQICWRD